jgi:asparagine synthase (glutamine-hydrolysing)
MADEIIARGTAETPRLETISYYDDDEPNWDERPYFTKVEQKRGHTGWHIDVGTKGLCRDKLQELFEDPHGPGLATPGSNGRSFPQFGACIASQGNRVVLSGIGGDEVMGGVPTCLPELENLLARGQVRTLARQLRVWALQMRKPWFHLFLGAMREFFPPAFIATPKYLQPVPWLRSEFVRRNRLALTGYPIKLKLFGALPSFQGNIATIDQLRRQLCCTTLAAEPHYEKRYPYLDRGLLEFVFAIPREQLVRPTQRRSLMRRALVRIVPDEILNKKGKAFGGRSALVAISDQWTHLVEITQSMVTGSLGIVDPQRFLEVLQRVRSGEQVPIVAIIRTICIEMWLRHLRSLGIIKLGTTGVREFAWNPSIEATGRPYHS